MASLAATRSRAREERDAQAIRNLPREVKAGIMADIDAHAPELRDAMEQCQAVPMTLRVRDRDGWRDVVSAEILKQYAEDEQ